MSKQAELLALFNACHDRLRALRSLVEDPNCPPVLVRLAASSLCLSANRLEGAVESYLEKVQNEHD